MPAYLTGAMLRVRETLGNSGVRVGLLALDVPTGWPRPLCKAPSCRATAPHLSDMVTTWVLPTTAPALRDDPMAHDLWAGVPLCTRRRWHCEYGLISTVASAREIPWVLAVNVEFPVRAAVTAR